MNTSTKSPTRPNTGNRLRLPTRHPRERFLETDVTADEHQDILEHCLTHKISVSHFLADLILKDAANAKARKNVSRKTELELSADEYDKLQLLVRLYKKNSVTELIRELLQPHLDLQRLHGVSEKARSLRFYLDDREHEKVTTYLADRGTTARKYVAFLAWREIQKSRKARSK